MQRHLVLSVHVDAFDNVDFAAVGPVGADGPEGGPDGAAVGDCVGVEDEEAGVI